MTKEKVKLKLGLNPGVSNADYHADTDYLSSTVLKTLLKSASDYERFYVKKEPKPAPGNQNALDEGSLAHSMILEPHLVQSEYNFYPGALKRGTDYESFARTCTNNKPIISAPQKDRLNRLYKAYKAHAQAPSFINGAEVEYTICAELEGVPVKVRFDATQLDKNIISDVKTTGYSGELDSFKQTVKDLQYDLSAALYTMVAEAHFGRPFDFYFIVLSKQDFSCHVYKTSQETLARGRRKVNEALAKYKRCKATGLWTDDKGPASPASEEIQEV